jgi:hypothetical protein
VFVKYSKCQKCFKILSIFIICVRRTWEDNIKMDLQEVGFGCVDWIELLQDRERWWALLTAVKNLRVP